jgi:hypothetical protein
MNLPRAGFLSFRTSSSGGVNIFPVLPLFYNQGSKLLKRLSIRLLNPLKTDRTITSAMVPTIIPNTEIAEIMLIMFCFFFENKYRSAMNSGRFNVFMK